MKRFAISTVFSFALVATTFACVATTDDVEAAKAPVAHPNKVITPADAPKANEDVQPVVFEVPVSPYARVLPFGAFPDVKSLCATQMELIKPYLAELEKSAIEEESGIDFVPSCKEAPAVLSNVGVSLDGGFKSVKAIAVATGHSTDVFLVVENSAGFTALREAFLSQANDDPGCPSIERENAFSSISAKNGTLVVVTESDRSWWGQKEGDDDSGELLLVHARACSFGEWGPLCGAKETIKAKLLRRPIDDPDNESVIEEVFTTDYTVADENVIHTTKTFDDASL